MSFELPQTRRNQERADKVNALLSQAKALKLWDIFEIGLVR